MTRPRLVNSQYPSPERVAEMLVTDSPGCSAGLPPKKAASPRADTWPAASTIQYPLPEGERSKSTTGDPVDRAPPKWRASPNAYTEPSAPTIQYPPDVVPAAR